MKNWFDNILKGKTHTFNVIAVIFAASYCLLTLFSTSYLLFNVTKFDKDTLKLIFDNLIQMKEIILVVLGAFIQRRLLNDEPNEPK